MSRALVALGSNIPPRRATLRAAVEALDALPGTRVLAVSRFHETAPVDAPDGSGPFMNGACLLSTTLHPEALLDELLGIEEEHGRVREERNGPRTLDLDLVLHGDQVLETEQLTLPHPRAHERLFVLEPAVEVAPAMRHPTLDRNLLELRDALRAGVDVTATADGADP